MTKKLRLLVAEGASREAACVLRELFSKDPDGLELTEVSGVSMLMASLKLVNPEAILLELALVGPDPLEAVRLMHRANPEVPLIVIGNSAEKETAAASLNIGAMNYLLKGQMDARRVERVLRGALERNTLKGLADLLRDALTGLYIRDGFLTLGEQAMEAAKHKGGDLVLLCARIEGLEAIQKQFGQNAAESSLREVAGMLTRSFRGTDVVGRIGESQFAALAVDAVEPSVPVLLQRLRKRLEGLNRDIGAWGPLKLRMTAKFWSGKQAGTFAEFLDDVEAGLRHVEAAGEEDRNCGLVPGRWGHG